MNALISISTMIGLATCSAVKTGRLLGLEAGIYDALFEINLETGEAKELHSFSVDPSEGGLAVGPDGTLYAAFSGDVDGLVMIDPLSGDLTLIGAFGFNDVSGLAFGPDGTLYGYDNWTAQLVTIDLMTGQGTAVGPGPENGDGLAYSADGILYLVGTPGLESVLYTLDPNTGEATEIGPFGHGLEYAAGLEFIGDVLYSGAHWFAGPPYELLVTVDPQTGQAQFVGGYCSDGCKDGPYMGGLAFLPGHGDGDRDGDVDEDDVAFFEACFGALDEPGKSPYCAFLDSDKDGDLDCEDWEAFIPNWTEGGEPPVIAACDCENPPCDVACDGDANGDGMVDPLDTGYVMARFGCAVGSGDAECDAADVNADLVVDPLDAGYVLARFGVCE